MQGKMKYLVIYSIIVGLQLCWAGTISVYETDISLQRNINWIEPQIGLVQASRNETDSIFLTTDGGLTWTDISSRLEGSLQIRPATIHVNPHHREIIHISAYGLVAWVSVDGAQTFQKITTNNIYSAFEWHPHEPLWALASTPLDFYGSRYAVYLTQDGGKTFIKFREDVFLQQYSWGDAGRGDVPKTRVYMIVETTDDEIPFNLVQTDDWSQIEAVLQTRGYQFIFLRHQLLVAVWLPTKQDVTIKTTPYLGSNRKVFYEAKWPFGDSLPNNGYVILDDEFGSIFMGVNHGNFETSTWGNLYVSDSTGSRYVLSLSHLAHKYSSSYGPVYDFDRIAGLEGAYIANTVRNWQAENGDSLELQTFISYNNGGTWSKLAKPHYDSDGKPIMCQGDCSLHLNGWTTLESDLGPFYSSYSAPGLIIATGSVGEYLSRDKTKINTYMSRDGGLTWIELRKGASIYEFGDYGGIIVLAPFGVPTDHIYYSLTEGTQPLQVYTLPTNGQQFMVGNIVTEPKGTTEVFMLLGRNSEIFTLDFTQIFDRTCDNNTDYELWSPDDGFGHIDTKCLMGRTVTYKRRLPGSACFNPDGSHRLFVQNCSCIIEDYECDFGFERSPDGSCVLDGPPPAYPPAFCEPGAIYFKTRGYRKDPGNSCDEKKGVDLTAEGPYDCPKNDAPADLKKNKGWIAAAVVIPLIVVVIILGFIAVRSEKIRDRIPFLKCLGSWRVGYFGAPDTVDNIGINDDEDPIDNERRPSSSFNNNDNDHFIVGLDNDEFSPSSSTATTSNQPNVHDDFNPRG